MSSNKVKIILISGGSSGIGKATALKLRDMGCKVYEISRHESEETGVFHITADVTDEASIKSAVSRIIDKEGRIDVVINCAGFGVAGASEFISTNEAKAQFDINFFGTVNVNRTVIPLMREAGQGRIINVSSVAAIAPMPFQAYYGASKAALNSYSCALSNELKPFNISVIVVQPGDIATGFTSARKKIIEGDDCYNGQIARSIHEMEQDEINGMSAEPAGEYIAKLVFKRKVSPIYTIGGVYKFLSFLIKIFPMGLTNQILRKMYCK